MKSSPKPSATKRDQSGFSLLELLVALAVFGLAGMALLNLAGEGVRSQTNMETRTFAGVVAENLAVATVIAPTPPPLETDEGSTLLAGRQWRWTRSVASTDDPSLDRIDIRVLEEDRVVALLTAYRSRR